MSAVWAAEYIGRTDMHCWGLVRSVYEAQLGIRLVEYGDVDAQEIHAVAEAVAHGRSHSSTWYRVEPFPGGEQTFDVAVMKGWLATPTGDLRRGVIHTGVVSRKGYVLHTDLGYAVVEVGLDHPSVKRRLVGCYRHVAHGGGRGGASPTG